MSKDEFSAEAVNFMTLMYVANAVFVDSEEFKELIRREGGLTVKIHIPPGADIHYEIVPLEIKPEELSKKKPVF